MKDNTITLDNVNGEIEKIWYQISKQNSCNPNQTKGHYKSLYNESKFMIKVSIKSY